MLAPSTPPTPPTPCTDATTSESSCSAPSRPPPCRDCGAVFPTLPKLKYHRLRSHGAWAGHRECPRDGCTKRYATDSNLRRHLRRDHGERAEKEGAEVSVAAAEDKKVCPVCGFASADNFHLAVHIRKHTGTVSTLVKAYNQAMYVQYPLLFLFFRRAPVLLLQVPIRLQQALGPDAARGQVPGPQALLRQVRDRVQVPARVPSPRALVGGLRGHEGQGAPAAANDDVKSV